MHNTSVCRRIVAIVVASLIGMSSVAACGNRDAVEDQGGVGETAPAEPTTAAATPDDEPTIFFPQQAPVEGERVVMEALIFGELVLVDGCLRIKSAHADESVLVIWPPDAQLNTADGEVRVLTEDGQVVATVGEEVELGGGEVGDAERLQLQEPLPEACSGPYWLVGEMGPALGA